jgi:Zn-dependent peptidase ImmA (M78 family)/transcriptional regulator with XRE-family HTH domain
MIVRIPVNPDLLVWARETAGYSVADTATRFKKDEEEIRSWESGETVPTINQLRALAEFYRRPLGVLFRSERPEDRRLPRDFRRMPGTFRVSRQPEVIAELRSAQERREIALDLYQELAEEPPPFVLSAHLDEAPEIVGARIRTALGVTATDQFRWRDFYFAFNTWRERIEAQNVLVFQFSRIASEKMRGYSLAEGAISVIGVNRGEPPQARCFSLLHEFTHLLLRVSGVCDFAEDEQPPEEQRIEIFCNAVAAAALMPMADFLRETLVSPYPQRPREWDESAIVTLARRYKVSRDAMARRLYTANLATLEFYVRKHQQYLEEARVRKATQPDAPIGEKGGDKAAALLGAAYGRLVLASYHQDLISLRDVSSYLGMKLSYLGDFERAIGMG